MLGEFCPARSILGNSGIRQPRLGDPRRKRNGVLAGGGRARALFGASRFQSEYQKAGNGCISDSVSVICTKDEAREVLGDREFTMFGVFVSRTVISPANRQELAQGSSYHWVSGVALAPVEWGGFKFLYLRSFLLRI